MPDVTTSTETGPRRRDLIELLAPVRGKLVGAAVLQGLASAASIVPLVSVVEIARRLLASPDPDEHAIRRLVVVAVAAFSFRLIAQGASSQITHLADNTFQLEVRRRVAARLGRLPLTLVVIAHRLATVVAADQIAVLDGGRIAQRGTHAELLASGGLYADFWRERTRARGWRIAAEPA